ncbi:MAG: LPS biosynthesis glycosyltransferase [Gammaproteobacteria bacterium]|nr:LPS biosynthesis glycosyltransferase [Gammaproteobacteria bacterium]MCP5424709.1 LPS biosynthesis glycosyltransferase [Gammaproteobacteria bacterium]MCP5459256.1 LPS biosynthesis glycosyltransferase [Gammaproteobacteria bacterium]
MTEKKIRDLVSLVIIVAYKEKTSRLECAFAKEFFSTLVVRPNYSDEELGYSQTVRVLINHFNAWKICAKRATSTIVVEADFVPCVGFGDFPVPFSESMSSRAWGWLYSCGPTIYELIQEADCVYARGHSAAPVATIIGPEAANILCEFAEQEITEKNPYKYSYWDTYARMFLQKRGVNSYISFRNYGEHGGIPNPEHKIAGLKSVTHRADVLMNQLYFLPDYAHNRKIVFVKIRCFAKIKGWMRLIFFRTLEKQTLIQSSQRMDLLKFAFIRLLSRY